MKTKQCEVATNAALAASDTFRESMHEACAGAYRLAPTMKIYACGCSCHVGTSTKVWDSDDPSVTASLPILVAPAAEPPDPTPEGRKKPTKRPKADHRGGLPRNKCECGCGGLTGGRFVPGHDAKLKSELIRKARGGDPRAWAEIVLRKWDRLFKSDESRPEPRTVKLAYETVLDKPDQEAWLRERVKSRRG